MNNPNKTDDVVYNVISALEDVLCETEYDPEAPDEFIYGIVSTACMQAIHCFEYKDIRKLLIEMIDTALPVAKECIEADSKKALEQN